MNGIKQLSLYLTAGAMGALANSLVVWAAGATGLTAALGAKITPPLTASWLYSRLTWGAIWGLLFFFFNRDASNLRRLASKYVGNARKQIIRRGLLVSIAPTLAQLFVFFPSTGKGLLGLQLGVTVPLFVILFSAIWGIVAAAWVAAARR